MNYSDLGVERSCGGASRRVQVKKLAGGKLAIYLTIPRSIVESMDIRKGDEFRFDVVDPESSISPLLPPRSIIVSRTMQNISEPAFPPKKAPGRRKASATPPQAEPQLSEASERSDE